jgi:exonuclease III
MAINPLFSTFTLNVGGFKSRTAKVIDIYELVKNFNFVTLQETHFHNSRDSSFFDSVFETNFKIIHSFAEKRFAGICMLLNRKFSFGNDQILFAIKGRGVGTKVDFCGVNIVIIAIYAPAKRSERASFFEQLKINLDNIIHHFPTCSCWATLIL